MGHRMKSFMREMAEAARARGMHSLACDLDVFSKAAEGNKGIRRASHMPPRYTPLSDDEAAIERIMQAVETGR